MRDALQHLLQHLLDGDPSTAGQFVGHDGDEEELGATSSAWKPRTGWAAPSGPAVSAAPARRD
ncbi:hypothetical protein ACIRU3_24740 [Streptomyces sp. NPDC101151]|uniref:hypothetical protein n=1 Tax=Streptomyces sp. NPDC101151 TaxID=3366115 RepID=UPI0038125458